MRLPTDHRDRIERRLIMIDARVGDVVRVTLPWSEVCMHMRVADKEMNVRVLEHGAELLREDGSSFCAPITHGEAGINVVDDDDDDELPDTCLNTVDGHWYVITYGRAPYQIHAKDCATCGL